MKTNIGVKVDRELWTEFRINTIRNGIKMGALIESWIKEYLNAKKGQPTKSKASRFRGND